jgi:hypothetical protein
MKSSAIRRRLGLGAAMATMVWAGFVTGSTPARAFDDKPSTFDPIMNLIGLGKEDDDKPQIDFRERPKLVVPKSTELPPPQAGGNQRAANWPVDQDTSRRRAAQAAAKAPRVIGLNANPMISPAELQKGRSDEKPTSAELCNTRISGTPDCSALTPTEKLKQVFSLGGPSSEEREVSKPGVEPDREYLTEPPKGYRKASTYVEVKQRAPNRNYEAPSAGDYARGVDPNKPTE